MQTWPENCAENIDLTAIENRNESIDLNSAKTASWRCIDRPAAAASRGHGCACSFLQTASPPSCRGLQRQLLAILGSSRCLHGSQMSARSAKAVCGLPPQLLAAFCTPTATLRAMLTVENTLPTLQCLSVSD